MRVTFHATTRRCLSTSLITLRSARNIPAHRNAVEYAHGGDILRDLHNALQTGDPSRCWSAFQAISEPTTLHKLWTPDICFTLLRLLDDDNTLSEARRRQRLSVVLQTIPRSIINDVISSYVRAGWTARAMRIKPLMEAVDKKPNKHTYIALLPAVVQDGSLAQVEDLITEMVQRNLKPTALDYGFVLKACRRAGAVDRGDYWYRQMVEKGLRPTVRGYNSLISLFLGARDLPQAESLFQEMKANEVVVDDVIFYNFIDAHVKLRNMDAARRWLDNLQGEGIKVKKTCPYLPIIKFYLDEDRLDDALNLLNAILPDLLGSSDIIFQIFVSYYGERGDFTTMLDWFHRIQAVNLRPTEGTYRTIMDAYGKSGRIRDAEAWYEQMKKSGYMDTDRSLHIILNAYIYAQEFNNGFELWNFLRYESGWKLHPRTLSIFADLCGFAGRVDMLKSELPALEREYDLNENVYCSVVEAYCRNGKIEEAIRVVFETMRHKKFNPSKKCGETLVGWTWSQRGVKEGNRLREKLVGLYPYLKSQLFSDVGLQKRSGKARRSSDL